MNNKHIGSAFERYIAKLLSLKLSNNTRTDIFCRTPGSGNTYVSGDIMLCDNEYIFDYVVECKTIKKGYIIPLNSTIKQFIDKCEDKYKDRKWLLILKIRNRQNIIYTITNDDNSIRGDVIAYIRYKNKTYKVVDFKTISF